MEIQLNLPFSVEWKEGQLYFLEQTLLPNEERIERQESVEQVWDSIKKLKVRGAPALGVAGGYGLLVGIKPHLGLDASAFMEKIEEVAAYLDSSRPTAVNLGWALRRMVAKAKTLVGQSPEAMYQQLEAEAIALHQEDIDCSVEIGKNGAPLIKEGMGVLTHCNAGHLAVSKLGTALAPMYTAFSEGRKFRVYADETRPLLQGARLTAWELQRAGLDVTLICDNMAGYLMSQGLIDLVIVGADRIAANGDAVNKIGTYSVAILAKYFNIPFYVAAPYSTIDLSTATGKDVVIEEREPEEVTFFGAKRTGPEGIKVRNPAFDPTENKLIHGIITEKGLITPPFDVKLKELFG
ncbi:MAG: S-methyl-5-thioribose-1-phosphate isomerase [bacterium]|nr:S-methyl-5-thioribose-1-phosphate isomerase [bacterium]